MDGFAYDEVSRDFAENILDKYDFLDFKMIAGNGNYNQVHTNINVDCNCNELKNFLLILNEDPDIFSATPVFYPKNDISNDFYLILLSELVTEPKEDIPTTTVSIKISDIHDYQD